MKPKKHFNDLTNSIVASIIHSSF